MIIERFTPCILALAPFVLFSTAAAQEPQAGRQALPQGMRPHLSSAAGGQIDWANGLILAEGIGKAHGKTDQDRLMAERAGKVVAARNALAMALGVRVDGRGRFSDLGYADVHVRGVLKGYKIVSVDWRPNATPPECTVVIEAPIWGAKAVASIVTADAVRTALRRKRSRLMPAKAGQGESDEILVIDARGLTIEPCLFPVVEEQGGTVLYDVATIGQADQSVRPPIRYVETAQTFEELRTSRLSIPAEAALGETRFSGSVIPSFATVPSPSGVGSTLSLIHTVPALMDKPPASKPAATQPTSKPARKPRRQRRVLRAVKTTGGDKTKIVLTKQDAEKLRNTAKGANLLRSGRVIVVVDSVAAGIEGRLDVGPEDRTFARAE